MHVLVQTSYNKDLIVVVDWVGSKEFLWLFQGAILSLHLICLGVEAEAVADPALVTTENQNFVVAVREASNGISCRPGVILVDDVD